MIDPSRLGKFSTSASDLVRLPDGDPDTLRAMGITPIGGTVSDMATTAAPQEPDSTDPHVAVLTLIEVTREAMNIADGLQKQTAGADPATRHAATQVAKLLGQVGALLGTMDATLSDGAGHSDDEEEVETDDQSAPPAGRAALAAALAKRRTPPRT